LWLDTSSDRWRISARSVEAAAFTLTFAAFGVERAVAADGEAGLLGAAAGDADLGAALKMIAAWVAGRQAHEASAEGAGFADGSRAIAETTFARARAGDSVGFATTTVDTLPSAGGEAATRLSLAAAFEVVPTDGRFVEACARGSARLQTIGIGEHGEPRLPLRTAGVGETRIAVAAAVGIEVVAETLGERVTQPVGRSGVAFEVEEIDAARPEDRQKEGYQSHCEAAQHVRP
jgi:hypothetical protein